MNPLKLGCLLLMVASPLWASVLPSARRMATPTPTAIATYTANATTFDNADALAYTGGSGLSDGKKGTVSFWFKLSGGDGGALGILYMGSGWPSIDRYTDNTIKFALKSGGAPVFVLQMHTASTYTASANWHHLLAYWDLSLAVAKIYVDGVDDTTVETLIDTDVAYGVGNCELFNSWQGELCEVYINLADCVTDGSKFSSGGKPIALGTDGSTPSGNIPFIYLKSAYSDFGNNSGSGPDFTVSGTLTSGTPP